MSIFMGIYMLVNLWEILDLVFFAVAIKIIIIFNIINRFIPYQKDFSLF